MDAPSGSRPPCRPRQPDSQDVRRNSTTVVGKLYIWNNGNLQLNSREIKHLQYRNNGNLKIFVLHERKRISTYTSFKGGISGTKQLLNGRIILNSDFIAQEEYRENSAVVALKNKMNRCN